MLPAAPEASRSWHPALPGVDEVLHARFTDHAYPLHSHGTWTVLLVDRGLVRYRLGRHERSAGGRAVTVLPPHVAHDGRSARSGRSFTKRVLYLRPERLGLDLVGPAVDGSSLHDPALVRAVADLHRALLAPADDLEAEALLAAVDAGVAESLGGRSTGVEPPSSEAAEALRAHLDADLAARHRLDDVAVRLGWSTTHLIRSFTDEYGLPPHRYLVGRRVEAARRLLLEGVPASQVAVDVGFYDQAHLTRHFRQHLATSPARYQRSRAA